MPYTQDRPATAVPRDELRARIPGWGADLDPKDRPSVPREILDPAATGAPREAPEQQPELTPRERSIEYPALTPVFGTAQPLHGLSGVIRRHAYARYGEGRAAHWLLLMAADRVDVAEHVARSFATLRPDNPVTQTGVLSEFRHRPVASRRGRVDVRHQAIDPLVTGAPWVLGVWLAWRAARAVRRLRRRA